MADHYFSEHPSAPEELRRIRVSLADRDLDVLTARGVFSPDHVDVGTEVLLGNAPDPPPGGEFLDLGCGWGPVSLSLALRAPRARIWAVDVNERALDLVRRNAAELGLDNVNAARPEDVPDDIAFRTIWSNPPIRVGKAVLHEILETWLPRLCPRSDAYLVVQRNLGSDSLQRWLAATLDAGFSVQRHATSKGFRVLQVRRHGAPPSGPVDVV
ncbi:methyltransferase [Microbacterium betulae]|uniref:Methyltransferase n=1 Tax=Microbacterium betulae TaxID=2981139 RepID=A0AA97FFD8_9MICO|nr:methyltransferase [Microbacterium sp. AB]WOF22015.1 methyltransferase [Microbacterium sp. AB]